MIGDPKQCMRCKHQHQVNGLPLPTCDAFPEEIPDDILAGEDHRQPYPGDHGIRWEPKAPGVKHPLDEPK